MNLIRRFALKIIFYSTITLSTVIAQRTIDTTITNKMNMARIGAIFTDDQKDSQTELAFKYAVYRINRDKSLLPNTTLIYDIQYVPKDDSFHASKKACYQVSSGVIAIFGPQDDKLGAHVQSLCDALDIPHIESRPHNIPAISNVKEFSINLHPGAYAISQSLRLLVKFLNWTQVAVIYEDDMSLISLQELVRLPLRKSVQFIYRKSSREYFRETLKDIKNRNIYSIIVDTKPESLPLLLTAILQVQMNEYKYHYHFTTFDLETFDLEDFKYNYVNMTAFRLVDSDNTLVRHILRDIERFQPIGNNILNKTNVIQADPALMYDAVYALAKGLHLLQQNSPFLSRYPNNASCDSEIAWTDGTSLFNYIDSVEFQGLTGKISFKEGVRFGVKMDLLKLRHLELDKVGEFTIDSGLNITKLHAFREFGYNNITLKVTTIESQPYIMLKQLNTSASVKYEGFCIDLLNAISKELGFNYELYLVPDKRFGAQNITTGQWNGLVRELIQKKADLALAPMTISYAREEVIDFTKPFMNLGIGILFKIPTQMPTRLFSFMSPLAVDIWLYVVVAYILVSSTLFIVARFSPFEWQNPHPCEKESDIIENQFSLADSFWFTVVTLMKQGCDLNPRSISTRIIGAIWWFFTLILISSYTANLAAFLTVDRVITPIESVEDLASQTKIKYGALEGGSTMTFFRDSKFPTYQKMWKYMEKNPEVFVSEYDDGYKRVIDGDYAFLMESTMLDYMVQRDCNLTQIGGLLDNKGYGIATPMGSPWKDRISLAILELQEKGEIQMIYDKWWKSPGLTCIRDEINKEGKASPLGLENIGGVFVVLMLGLALALFTAMFEFFFKSKKNAKKSRHSLCSEIKDELEFIMKCQYIRPKPSSGLRRYCSKCNINSSFITTSLAVPHDNGVMSGLDFRKSPQFQSDYDSS